MEWLEATIGNYGCQWLTTIGPTMKWLNTIREVYASTRNISHPMICDNSDCGDCVWLSDNGL